MFTIAALYYFTPITDIAAMRTQLLDLFLPLDLCGSLLIANEGVNGTLAGNAQEIEKMVTILQKMVGLPIEEVKYSYAQIKPFKKLKLRLEKEIVTLKQPVADPHKMVGRYVEPKDWNDLIADPDVVVLDTRNDYETILGTFDGAIVPDINVFSQFPAYTRQHLANAKKKKIAMFCTGGIRCEKASAFMLQEGYEEVYHLKGGILKYLEQIPAQQSKWKGDCYVFDQRMAVGHGLTTGKYTMCFCCGYALGDQEKASITFEEGVSCPYCHDKTTEQDKARFRMRHQQIIKKQVITEQTVNY